MREICANLNDGVLFCNEELRQPYRVVRLVWISTKRKPARKLRMRTGK